VIPKKRSIVASTFPRCRSGLFDDARKHIIWDKTRFISMFEEPGFPRALIFLRPRRFGKTNILSMLEFFHGVQHTASYDTLFDART